MEQQDPHTLEIDRNADNSESVKSRLVKLQRGLERPIDSYSKGVIDKEQFMPRLNRTKTRIAELEARIRAAVKELGYNICDLS